MAGISWFEWGNAVVTIGGLIVGVLGYVLSVVANRRTAQLRRNQRQQFISLLERANYAGFEHELFDAIAEKLEDKVALRYLAMDFQAAIDLYLMMVSYFLQNEETFTYDDFERVCDTPLITQVWQEEHWKVLVGLRDENKGRVQRRRAIMPRWHPLSHLPDGDG